MLQTIVRTNVHFITKEMKITDEYEIDKIRFGIETILGEVFKLSIIFLISLLINKGIEFFIVLSLLLSIRTTIGGSHAKSLIGCLFTSLLLFIILYYFSYKITNVPYFIEITIIPVIIFVLSTVKYKNKIDKSGNNEEKNKILRIKLISIASIALVISRFFFYEAYSLILITETIIILDYLKVRGCKL